MAKTAFIWDLDGTLLDSYEVIVSSLYETYREFGTDLDKSEILREVITHTVGDFISKMEIIYGIPFETAHVRYSEIDNSGKLNVRPMKNAPEILSYLNFHGNPNYVFTHKGSSTETILRNTGLYDFFVEIITGNDGFKRKPDPSAILYLINKYKLDREDTFYVGDRTLDVECAFNAGIKSILFLPPGTPAHKTGKETYIVHDLIEIKNLFFQE